MKFGSGLPRPDWTYKYLSLSKHLAINMVVWFGLEQLVQVIEMFTPVVDTLIAPSHLPHDLVMADECQPSYLFKRGDGVNVYSEGGYTLLAYHSCIQQYLQQGKPGLGIVINMDNVLLVGKEVGEILTTEKGVFNKTRTVKGFHLITSVQAMIDLTANNDVLKTKPLDEQKKKLDIICAVLNENALWPGFVV